MRRSLAVSAVVGMFFFSVVTCSEDFCQLFAIEPPKESTVSDTTTDSLSNGQLSLWQSYIGAWRGVGQPQRNSARGSWKEESNWSWKFAESGPTIILNVEQGKLLTSASIRAEDDPNKFTLEAFFTSKEKPFIYSGERNERGEFIFTADVEENSLPDRITFRLVAEGNRLVMIHERRLSDNRYSLLAEIGQTRKGVRLAQGDGQPECVVTGGLGTIEVEFKGMTYYVCCTGCKDLFDENPEKILAEYRQRKLEEQKKDKPGS